MSAATVKLELASRTGRNLLPSSFPTDLLISLIRELALVIDGGMTAEEVSEFGCALRTYIRKLVEMHEDSWLTYFDENKAELVPSLCDELYDHVRDELVSRLIEYNIRKVSLSNRLQRCLEPSVV